VVTYFIGYGALSIAFFTSVIYLGLFKKQPAGSSILSYLDTLTYQLIIFSFPFLTIGMTTGSTWANVAWGNYWSWDPKETCSLITWLVYVVYLHLRVLRGWKDKKAAYVSVIGFLATLFTFVGVNYILPGLHSYS
jgi:cytochrome c-type biogenesis protein CcsB